MDYDWLKLPEHLWIRILQQLDFKSLLSISETCSTLNNLLGDSIFSKELKFLIKFHLKRDNHLMSIFKHSNRKYRSVDCTEYYEKRAKATANFKVVLEILNRFSDSIREISIHEFKLSSSSWNRLIQALTYVESFRLIHATVYKYPTGIEKSVLKIDSIYMQFVDTGYMDIFDGASVKQLSLREDLLDHHIPFLMNHEELKYLKIYSELFINDELSNVKFSLDHLDLLCANWSNKQHALNFIRTQTELQSVFLRLTKDQYDILFLKQIINHNPKLKILYIELNSCANMFIRDIHLFDTKLSVTHFYFQCYPKNIEISEKVYRLFPNNIEIKDEIGCGFNYYHMKLEECKMNDYITEDLEFLLQY